ncbi:MAG: phasin family protein [Gammaproteobacteria bacterium]|nr:phasin family protein [Gammaproteobacteria bacterium]
MATPTDNLEILKDLGTSGFEVIRALGELNLRTWEKLMEQQMDTFGLCVNSGIEQVKLITETDDYAALVNGQIELNRQFSETLTEKTREAMVLSNEAGDEYRAWFENGVGSLTGQAGEIAGKAA